MSACVGDLHFPVLGVYASQIRMYVEMAPVIPPSMDIAALVIRGTNLARAPTGAKMSTSAEEMTSVVEENVPTLKAPTRVDVRQDLYWILN